MLIYYNQKKNNIKGWPHQHKGRAHQNQTFETLYSFYAKKHYMQSHKIWWFIRAGQWVCTVHSTPPSKRWAPRSQCFDMHNINISMYHWVLQYLSGFLTTTRHHICPFNGGLCQGAFVWMCHLLRAFVVLLLSSLSCLFIWHYLSIQTLGCSFVCYLLVCHCIINNRWLALMSVGFSFSPPQL